jgi:hypothetical protein
MMKTQLHISKKYDLRSNNPRVVLDILEFELSLMEAGEAWNPWIKVVHAGREVKGTAGAMAKFAARLRSEVPARGAITAAMKREADVQLYIRECK